MIIPDVLKTRMMSPPTNVRQRRGVNVSSRAVLLQNQEGVEEELGEEADQVEPAAPATGTGGGRL